MGTEESARTYVKRGWYPVPLRPRSKECRDKDWRERVYSPDEFGDSDNIGLRLVKKSDPDRACKLVAVDLDCSEAVALASAFLPPSLGWGRASKALSQVLYVCPVEKALVVKDAGSTLVEIRVDHQSMCPPSVHPNGEALEWSGGPDVVEIDASALERSVRLLATASACARHWPPAGARHDPTLALAGALRGLGLTEAEAERVVDRAATVVGDPNPRDRTTEVRTTYARPDDEPTTGLARLEETGGKELAEVLRSVWTVKTRKKTGRGGAVDQDAILRATEKLSVRLGADAFAGRLVWWRNGSEAELLDDAAADWLWLATERVVGIRPPREFFDAVVRDAARAAKFHPVRDYLDSLTWDGKPRLSQWLVEYGGARPSKYVEAVGRSVLLAAVRRVRRPGAKFDEMLVLESEQGYNKSTALRSLCPRDDWFSDDLPLGVDSKQVIERTAGKWIIEAAELVNMRKTQVEMLKSFLSRQVDGPVRLAYGRFAIERAREFILVGTTNTDQYLRDTSGNRRFWPVSVRRFDVARLAADRDQIWAEASAIEAAGAPIHLEPTLWGEAAGHQKARETDEPWTETLSAAVSGKRSILPDEMWTALGIPTERRDGRGAERIAAVLRSLGFRRGCVRRGPRVARGWLAGDALPIDDPDGAEAEKEPF
jgi:hypothetical protein